MKKKVSMMLAVSLILVLCFSAVASADDIQPRASSYLSSYSVRVIPEENRKMTVTFSVRAINYMSEVGATKIVIERRNGTKWVTDRTFYASSYSNFMRTNTVSTSSSISFYGTQGVFYRAKLYAYASDGKGSDTKMMESSSANCR